MAEDLKFLESQFAGHQKDFGKMYPHFQEEMPRLRSEIGKLSDAEIVSRVMKMVASANVGHNIVYLPAPKLGFQAIRLHGIPMGSPWLARRPITRRQWGRIWCGSGP